MLKSIDLAAPGKQPIVYVDRTNRNTNTTPIFFIDRDFSLKSLVRLVYDSAATESKGGQKNKSQKSKKSIKIKKRYIRSRKHTNKYRRRSYQH